MKQHSATGYRICSEVEEFSHVANEILTHHENWNGKGYLQGLKGEKIPILSRIIRIVDAFDVMTHDRIYKKAITKEDAIKELKKCAGKQFDPELAESVNAILWQSARSYCLECTARGEDHIFEYRFRKEDILARTGGDEFVVLLTETDGNSTKKYVYVSKINLKKLDKYKI